MGFNTMNSLLEKMVERLSDSPVFLAYRLKQYALRTGKNWDAIASELSVSPDQLGRLALCRPPRSETKLFILDVHSIAEAIPMPVTVLANFLRQQDMLRSYDSDSTSQIAARDRDDHLE